MAYLPKLNPTVGKGLGGFPERVTSEGLSASVGDVIFTAGVMAEPKWLPADGRVVVEADYHELFTALGESLDNYTSNPTITPSTLPTGTGYGVAFSPDGNYLSVAYAVAPFITIYRRDGDTFTKLTNPSTLPTGVGFGVAFSPDGNYLSVAHDTTPYITIYRRDGDTFTKLTNPSTLPTSRGYGVAFSPGGNYLSVAHDTAPYITIYRRDGDTFTKLTNPSTLPTNTGYGVAFSPDGNYLSVAYATTPHITIYNRLDGVPLRFIIPNLSSDFQGVYTPTIPRDPYMRVKS